MVFSREQISKIEVIKSVMQFEKGEGVYTDQEAVAYAIEIAGDVCMISQSIKAKEILFTTRTKN